MFSFYTQYFYRVYEGAKGRKKAHGRTSRAMRRKIHNPTCCHTSAIPQQGCEKEHVFLPGGKNTSLLNYIRLCGTLIIASNISKSKKKLSCFTAFVQKPKACLPSPGGEGGIRRSPASRMTDEVGIIPPVRSVNSSETMTSTSSAPVCALEHLPLEGKARGAFIVGKAKKTLNRLQCISPREWEKLHGEYLRT